MKRGTSYKLIISSFFWFFLIVPIFQKSAIQNVIIYSNYLIYTAYLLWWLHTLFFKSFKKSTSQYEKEFYKQSSYLVLWFVLIAGLQILINPQSSDFITYRKTYAVAIPSIAMALLIGIYLKSNWFGFKKSIKSIYYLLVLIAISSEVVTFGKVEDRSTGIFDQANNYGYFLTLLLILTVENISGHLVILKSRYLSIMIYLIGVGLVIKTGSYGSLIIVLITSIYLMSSNLKKLSIGKLVNFGIFVTLLSLGVTFFISNFSGSRVNALRELSSSGNQEGIEKQSTFGLRFELIKSGWELFGESLFSGRGYDGRYIRVEQDDVPVHNSFIVEGLKGGVILPILMLILYYKLLLRIIRMNSQSLKKVCFALLFFLFISDNSLTYFTFLSMNSGVIALAFIIILLKTDSLRIFEQGSGSKQPKRLVRNVHFVT